MKKEKHSADESSKQSLHEILLDIKYRLNHIEDISADNRAIIVKLVKQNNTIVDYLKQLEVDIVEGIEDEFDTNIPILEKEQEQLDRVKKVKDLLDEFEGKSKDLKEFEEELKKHKDKLTPGQVGDA